MAFPFRAWARALAAGWLLILLVLASGCQDHTVGVSRFHGLDLTGASYGRDFRLLDAQGRERSLADFRGKVVLLYFGFTQCPDVCPTALSRAVEVKTLLGAEGERLQVIFVTIDPERDTPQVIQPYVAAFDPSFLGLYGDAQRTREIAAEFKVFYQKVPTGGSYTMDHSTLSYVFDPQGRLRLALRHEQNAQDYAQDLQRLLQGD
jgi:protein SCO1/2